MNGHNTKKTQISKFRNFQFSFFLCISFVFCYFANFGGFWSGMASLEVSDIDICKSASVCKEIHYRTRSTTIFKSIQAKMRYYARVGQKTWGWSSLRWRSEKRCSFSLRRPFAVKLVFIDDRESWSHAALNAVEKRCLLSLRRPFAVTCFQ